MPKLDYSKWNPSILSDVTITRMDKLRDAKDYLHGENCTICGVEIMEGAKDVTTHPFRCHRLLEGMSASHAIHLNFLLSFHFTTSIQGVILAS
jgi:hypothetical protein